MENHEWSWITTGADNTAFISTLQYQNTNPAHPEEPVSPSQSLTVTSVKYRQSVPNFTFRWLYQRVSKTFKICFNPCWCRKKQIVSSALIFLFLWLAIQFRKPLALNFCHLYGVSHLSFCKSPAVPLPDVKLNVPETLFAANDNFTSIVEHVAVMHAFPELLFGLQWTMTNLSADMTFASHYPETRRNLLLEFREYRSTSSTAYTAIRTLFSGIYNDVGVVLSFTYDVIAKLQQSRNRAHNRIKNQLTKFVWGLDRQPTRPVIGITIPPDFAQYLDRLLPKLKIQINACDRLVAEFNEVLRRLDSIRAIADKDRDRYKAEHLSTIRSRRPKLCRWIISLIMNRELPEDLPSSDEPSPDEKLTQFRPIIVQGSQSIEYILSKYRTIYVSLEHLADQMKQHERWAEELSPQALMHDLRLGVKSLTQVTEEWIQLLIDDYTFLRLNPSMKRELNPLTRKMEAQGQR